MTLKNTGITSKDKVMKALSVMLTVKIYLNKAKKGIESFTL